MWQFINFALSTYLSRREGGCRGQGALYSGKSRKSCGCQSRTLSADPVIIFVNTFHVPRIKKVDFGEKTVAIWSDLIVFQNFVKWCFPYPTPPRILPQWWNSPLPPCDQNLAFSITWQGKSSLRLKSTLSTYLAITPNLWSSYWSRIWTKGLLTIWFLARKMLYLMIKINHQQRMVGSFSEIHQHSDGRIGPWRCLTRLSKLSKILN